MMQKRNWIVIIVIIAAVTIFSIVNPGYGVTPNFGDVSLTINGPKDFSYTIQYEDIEEVFVDEEFEAGEKIDGGEEWGFRWGKWTNSKYGEYSVAMKPKWRLIGGKPASVIVVKTNEDGKTGYYMFNVESDDTTKNLMEMFKLQVLQEQGYNVK